jgi:murein DD-endopeptidase MepM/ murein hydrolase activator NlpD
MERYSLIVVADETAPIRRLDVRKDFVKRGLVGLVVVACLLLVGLVDYVRVRIDHSELQSLRDETQQQRAQIESFDDTLAEVEGKLERLRDFERKVRIIANLPGAAATGGEEVTAVPPTSSGDLDAQGDDAEAVEVHGGAAAVEAAPPPAKADSGTAPDAGESASGAAKTAERVSVLRRDAERLGLVANARTLSISDLLDKLEAKRKHLESTPAIWPTRGWLTSRFGNRISAFTGARQFHAGIDIAGAPGTDVIAPARGRVVFAGKRGPLGNSLTLDHGYGVRTIYGHTKEIFVTRGQEIQRGQVIAALGNSGRSTGPHLHYVVEVKGKAVNPLDYIFD